MNVGPVILKEVTLIAIGVTVHGAAGDWSIFRRENVISLINRGPKTWTCPPPAAQGDSPIFVAAKLIRGATSLAPRKLGQSPVNGHPSAVVHSSPEDGEAPPAFPSGD